MWYLFCSAVKLHLLVSVVFINMGWLSNSIRILGMAGNISLSCYYTALYRPLWESALHKWKAHAEALKRNNPVLQRKTISICRLNLKTLCRCSRGVGKGEETGWVISLSGVCCVSVKTFLPFNIIKGQAVRKKRPLKGHNPRALANLDNWKDFLSFLKQGTQLAAPSLPLLPFCVPWPSKPLASLSGLTCEPARTSMFEEVQQFWQLMLN